MTTRPFKITVGDRSTTATTERHARAAFGRLAGSFPAGTEGTISHGGDVVLRGRVTDLGWTQVDRPYQRVVVVGPNLSGALQKLGQFHVHAEGCADLKRGDVGHAYRQELAWGGPTRLTITSRHDVEAYLYDWAPAENEEYVLGDYQTEFHFAPCVTVPTSIEDEEVATHG